MDTYKVDLSKMPCYYCGKMGHMQRECRKRARDGAPMVSPIAHVRHVDVGASIGQRSGEELDLRGLSSSGQEFVARALDAARTMGGPSNQAQRQGFRHSRK